ncbi:MAG: CotH kinase family protein, partial [Bacteroidota bacterium]|nr:CotH kinase family protein [Bacteroidota bacterium]
MRFLWIFFILSTSLSCKKENIQIISDQEELNNIISSFEEYIYENDHLSDYIYDQNKLHRFDLFLTQENLDEINNNPAAEKYVEGSLVFEGKVIKNVGIRYKGSIGAWVGCLSNEDWTNPSGYKTCPKLSMKIKINWQGDNKFYGMKKLQFHSQNLDKSKMHERLGYYMFRNFGITAPRSNHALLYINGEFNGVFANTENVDGPFTNKHFINRDGNLYKEVWPIKSSGGNREENYFIDGLKTNEEISDVTKIKRFSDQLGSVNKSDANEIVEDWIDKDLFLKTILVDRRIANDDGFMHFYHEGGLNYENHNYYWYEDPNDDKLQLIPWDLDNSFENLISNLNPVTPIKDKW